MSLGRHRRGWDDNIKIMFEKDGKINLTEDGIGQRA
jgi:hypothetical protein